MYFFSQVSMVSRNGFRPGLRPTSESIIAAAVSWMLFCRFMALKSSIAAAALAAVEAAVAGPAVGVTFTSGVTPPFLQAVETVSRAAVAKTATRTRRERIEIPPGSVRTRPAKKASGQSDGDIPS